MVRRAIALGLLALLLILIVLGVKSCRDSARKSALRNYNRDVAALIQESDSNGKDFFAQLAGSRSPSQLETQVNQARVVAQQQADRAKAFSVPGDAVDAQRNLVLALNLRTQALEKIGGKVRSAFATDRTTSSKAVNQIAGQMQVLLASDIVYSQRVAPLIKESLDANGTTGETIATSRVLPNLGWLDPPTVASRLGKPSAGNTPGGPIAPGLHGHGLTSVSIGSTALQPSPGVNRIAASPSLAFDVKFANQGANDEVDVGVRVEIKGGSGKPITVTKSVGQTKAGTPAEATIPLGKTPPVGAPVTITVTILAVPGEKKLDNNKQTYTAIFTR